MSQGEAMAVGLALEWAMGPCGGLGTLRWAWGPGAEPANRQGQGGAWAGLMGLLGAVLDLPWAGPTQLGPLPGQLPPNPHNCMRRWELGEEGVTKTPGGMPLPFHICVSAPLLCAPVFSMPHTALEARSTCQATLSSWVWNWP